ncbi:MAG: flippase-like domain-containing protein [Patescibacteria group bacterium]|nr:flippase-like domain-containing protein [Patescibacteria group bacterium]
MIKKIISIVVFLSLLVLVVYFVKGHSAEFQNIRFISREYLLVILICVFIYFLIQGIILKLLLEIFNIKLQFKEWFGITAVTLMGNYLIPFGGFGFRAAYLKKVYKFKYTHFIGTLGGMYLIEFTIFGLGGLLGLAAAYASHHFFNLKLLLLFVSVILGCIGFIILAPRFPRFSKNKYLMILSRVFESLKQFKEHPSIIYKLILMTLMELLFFTLIFFFSYQALNLKVSLGESFLVAGLSGYAFFIRLLPASFGFYEGAVVYTSHFLGLDVTQGLMVAALTRVGMIFWAFTLGVIFSLIILKKSKAKNV